MIATKYMYAIRHMGKSSCSKTRYLLDNDTSRAISAEADAEYATLKGLKGVDAAASRADVAKKEIHVKLDDQGGAKLADIEKALADFRK